MSVIAPAITVETAEEYKSYVEILQPFASRVQIDISDGEFAPRFLFPADQLWWPKNWEVDIHAMVSRPVEHVDNLINLKPSLIIFHVETGVNIMPIIEKVKAAGIKAGIALLKTTVPATVIDLIKTVDHVLVFTGDLGQYGGTASLMQLEKVRLIRSINPEVEIGWDGGVNLDNAFTLSHSGVDVLNVGGAIANAEDPAQTYYELNQEINKRGVI
jgi:ribulose-phosphate 3-epimerase